LPSAQRGKSVIVPGFQALSEILRASFQSSVPVGSLWCCPVLSRYCIHQTVDSVRKWRRSTSRGESSSGTQTRRRASVPRYSLIGDMESLLLGSFKRHQDECPNCPYVFHFEGRRIGDFPKSGATACKQAGVPDSCSTTFDGRPAADWRMPALRAPSLCGSRVTRPSRGICGTRASGIRRTYRTRPARCKRTGIPANTYKIWYSMRRADERKRFRILEPAEGLEPQPSDYKFQCFPSTSLGLLGAIGLQASFVSVADLADGAIQNQVAVSQPDRPSAQLLNHAGRV
jgi:hypothetical protein